MSAAVAAAAAAALANRRNSARTTTRNNTYNTTNQHYLSFSHTLPRYNRYETQKRQDWNTFDQYLKNHHHQDGQPPPCMRRCSESHVLQFLKYLDQFGETKVHNMSCKYYGQTHPPAACSCPLKKAWSGLEAVVGRLRVAFEEHGGSPETNPFGSKEVVLYIKQVKEGQAKARGLSFGCK